jgi:hypothetical protein
MFTPGGERPLVFRGRSVQMEEVFGAQVDESKHQMVD